MGFGLKTSLRPRKHLPLILSWQSPACSSCQVCSGQPGQWVVGWEAESPAGDSVWVLQLRQASPLKSLTSFCHCLHPTPTPPADQGSSRGPGCCALPVQSSLGNSSLQILPMPPVQVHFCMFVPGLEEPPRQFFNMGTTQLRSPSLPRLSVFLETPAGSQVPSLQAFFCDCSLFRPDWRGVARVQR